ncbi:hypothetical protein ACOMHN_060310 [Nucella lapillus]
MVLKSTEAKVENKDLSPLEVLQQKDFYILWFTLGMNHYGYVIKNNYYKEFGAARVDNDHLLTTIGTVSTIAVAVSRLCFGLVCDLADDGDAIDGNYLSADVIICLFFLSLSTNDGDAIVGNYMTVMLLMGTTSVLTSYDIFLFRR